MAAEFAELQGHDAYSLLGLPPSASQEQIQRSYRRLMKSVHPDLNAGAEDVTSHAALLNAARTVLLTRREAYDEFRHRPVTPPVTPPVAEPAPEPVREPGREPVAEPAPEPDWPYVRTSPPRRPAPVQWSSGRSGKPGKSRPSRKKQRGRIRVVPIALALLAIGAAITFFVQNAKNAPTPEPAVAVPAKLAGSWTGTLRNPDDKSEKAWRIELTLTAGKTNGEVHYDFGDGCSGTAVPSSTWQQALVLDTVFDDDQSGCDLGNLYVKATGSGKASVELHEHDKTLTGSMTKAAH